MLMKDGHSDVAPGTPFEDPENIVPIKRGGEHYIIRDQFYTAVNLVKVDDGSVISDDELRSKTVTISEGYILVDCVDVVCKQSQGYVVDGGNNGIAFKGSDNGEATASNSDKYVFSDSCNIDYNGKIKENKKVCINGEQIKLGESGIGKHIIFNALASTPFENDSNIVPIKHGYNYAIVDMFESVYLGNYIKRSITTDINSEYNIIINPGTINYYGLYDCNGGICKVTEGYIKVYGDKVYVVRYVGNIENDKIAYSVKEDADCNEDNIGLVFSDNSGICYMYGASLKFGEKSGVYMIMGGAAGTIFANEKDGYLVKSEDISLLRINSQMK